MGLPHKILTRILWLALAISLIGAAILFNPTLEFATVDILEKLHLPAGPIGNIAFIGDTALFAISAIGLIVTGIRVFFRNRRKP
jgi:hypothetical protein